jgi:uncharacterized protein (TIGR02271 family)
MSTQSYRAEALYGRTVYSSDGEKLGKVDDVLVDEHDTPVFIETKKGLFSGRRHIVPVSGMAVADDDLTVAYTKEQLENAPSFDPDDEVDYERERQLGTHYGTGVREWDDARDRWRGEDLSRGPTPETRHPGGALDDTRDTTQGPTPETRQTMRATEDDTRAAGQPEADRRTRGDVGGTQDAGVDAVRDDDTTTDDTTRDAMTRSEEELRVGTRKVEAGRARLRKWVETQPVSETVTTRRERARVKREPVTDANVDKAMSGPELSEEEHEVTLTAEEAVVEKRTVPKERVRLEKDTVTEEETVSEEVRKERIEVEGDADEKGGKRRRKK